MLQARAYIIMLVYRHLLTTRLHGKAAVTGPILAFLGNRSPYG